MRFRPAWHDRPCAEEKGDELSSTSTRAKRARANLKHEAFWQYYTKNQELLGMEGGATGCRPSLTDFVLFREEIDTRLELINLMTPTAQGTNPGFFSLTAVAD